MHGMGMPLSAYISVHFVYYSVVFWDRKSKMNVSKFQRPKKTKRGGGKRESHRPHLKAPWSPGSPFSLVLFTPSPAPAGSRDGSARPELICKALCLLALL